jgi:NAD(P)H-hydrate repair Nnr-like enzyme with NAD(P)H-hydrate epimerase domain
MVGDGPVHVRGELVGDLQGRRVVVAVGSGNNGCGGLVAARCLANRRASVRVILARPANRVIGSSRAWPRAALSGSFPGAVCDPRGHRELRRGRRDVTATSSSRLLVDLLGVLMKVVGEASPMIGDVIPGGNAASLVYD